LVIADFFPLSSFIHVLNNKGFSSSVVASSQDKSWCYIFDGFSVHEVTQLQPAIKRGMFHQAKQKPSLIAVLLKNNLYCVMPENIHTPSAKGNGKRSKNLNQCLRLNWNFQRGGGS